MQPLLLPEITVHPVCPEGLQTRVREYRDGLHEVEAGFQTVRTNRDAVAADSTLSLAERRQRLHDLDRRHGELLVRAGEIVELGFVVNREVHDAIREAHVAASNDLRATRERLRERLQSIGLPANTFVDDHDDVAPLAKLERELANAVSNGGCRPALIAARESIRRDPRYTAADPAATVA